ncbi:hypothetical protein [Usitatibacter palustris]|uniref:Invasion protein IalB, involved in pathogenesis n=1 Tax=Usitatibacter palustris TaxID=2732487 RepID=A0A6M4H635_9PROT|nr:hypothetical protein [Usitatibacter palustris]QJR13954.1 hypothetical protein DSM104440_00746 [Usitatibacter palustris]
MKRILALVAFALVFSGAQAAEPKDQLRLYPVKGWGALALRVPWDWKQKVDDDAQFPTFSLRPIKGQDFSLNILALPAKRRCRVPCDIDSLRFMAGNKARELKPQSLEPEIKLDLLKGKEAQGYYFSVTDRAPKKGEFKFLTMGYLAVGELVVEFRILVNDNQEDAVKAALEVLAGAREVKLPPEKPAPPKAMPDKVPEKKS